MFGGVISDGRVLLFPRRAEYVWQRFHAFTLQERIMFGGGILILPLQGKVSLAEAS